MASHNLATLAILSLGGRASLVDALVDARRSGSLVSFDPNFRSRLWADTTECRDAVSRMLGTTDNALPSFNDERTLWGDRSPRESVDRFLSLGVREVVLKEGSGFVTLSADGTVDMIETPLAADIRDTTGAGDSFNAGYLSARLEGARAAAAVAAGQKLSAEVSGTPSCGSIGPRWHCAWNARRRALRWAHVSASTTGISWPAAVACRSPRRRAASSGQPS